MGMAGATVGVRSSSFLADAVRETATNHCIDRVVNGSLDGTVAVVSKRYTSYLWLKPPQDAVQDRVP